MRPRQVTGPDAGGKPELRVVGRSDRFVFRTERKSNDHGAEDLFTNNGERWFNIEETRWFDEESAVPVTATASQCPSAVAEAGLKVGGNAVELLLGGQRSQLSIRVEAG